MEYSHLYQIVHKTEIVDLGRPLHFNALSYTWGYPFCTASSPPTEHALPIYYDRHCIMITWNLRAALCTIVYHKSPDIHAGPLASKTTLCQPWSPTTVRVLEKFTTMPSDGASWRSVISMSCPGQCILRHGKPMYFHPGLETSNQVWTSPNLPPARSRTMRVVTRNLRRQLLSQSTLQDLTWWAFG